jgi:tellurite resistance protein TerC
MIEITDLLFAIDSIPAVLSISQDIFVVFTSNIFAILGLRSLFFLFEGLVSKLKYLQTGLAFILLFIGLKMVAGIFTIEINSVISFLIILFIMSGAIAASLISDKLISQNRL